MLKRKANEFCTAIVGDSEDIISSKQEIHQRRIFRARRPSRNVSECQQQKFKIQAQLLSIEQELALLSVNLNTSTCDFGPFGQSKPKDPFGFSKFVPYSRIEPFKELIQNFNKAEESQKLKGFLDSSIEKVQITTKFSADCRFIIGKTTGTGLCKIVTCKDQFSADLVIENEKDQIILKQSINSECFCKEVQDGNKSALYVRAAKKTSVDEVIKLEMNLISKHMFLRCFAECKQSF